MLLRFAKIAGGLRAVVTEAGPIIATSVALLSARSVAYFVGFTLGSIVSAWLPIIATLISVAGFFNAGSNTLECEAYRAQMRAIDNANRSSLASWRITYDAWYKNTFLFWLDAKKQHDRTVNDPINQTNLNNLNNYQNSLQLTPQQRDCSTRSSNCTTQYGSPNQCSSAPACARCGFPCPPNFIANIPYPVSEPNLPAAPTLITYPACSAPDCPPGKKVWIQVLWASPNENFTEAKGCYIVAYSQDAPTLPVKIEYNPFLPKLFVESRALSYYLVNGDRYRGLQDNQWKNLESVSGWDKGYWRSEVTDPECRGWRPGWSRKVK
jgi:hypothetical protein